MKDAEDLLDTQGRGVFTPKKERKTGLKEGVRGTSKIIHDHGLWGCE